MPETATTLLIFNPTAGGLSDPGAALLAVLNAMQTAGFYPRVCLIQPGIDASAQARAAAAQGEKLVVVCGGDGTVDSIVAALVDTPTTLGIIPAGTRNNIAFTLGVPLDDPAAAVEILKNGLPLRVDTGRVTCGPIQRSFLETCSIGLFSALFPPADRLQKGDLSGIADLLTTLAGFPQARFRIEATGWAKPIEAEAQAAIAACMPLAGARFNVAPQAVLDDGLLDLTLFADLNPVELINLAIQSAVGQVDEPRLIRRSIREATIQTDPPLPVVADNDQIGSTPVRIEARPRSLSVMAPRPASGTSAVPVLVPYG
jgi:diacylglycerol kinase (ATP)